MILFIAFSFFTFFFTNLILAFLREKPLLAVFMVAGLYVSLYYLFKLIEVKYGY